MPTSHNRLTHNTRARTLFGEHDWRQRPENKAENVDWPALARLAGPVNWRVGGSLEKKERLPERNPQRNRRIQSKDKSPE